MERVSRHSGKRGFTLIEFLFVAFTLALFLTALFNITTGGLRAYQRGVVQTELKHEMRNIFDKFATDVRQINPATSTSPMRYYHMTATDNHATFHFDRFIYEADNTIPAGNARIIWGKTSITESITIGPVTYHMQRLFRRITTPTSNTIHYLSDNVVGADNTSGTNENKSSFGWELDPYPGGTSNIDTIRFTLKLMKTHAGSTEPETIENKLKVSLRAHKGLIADSNYYPPTIAEDPYANIQRFGSPTSLTRP